jgi:hypothetical protein
VYLSVDGSVGHPLSVSLEGSDGYAKDWSGYGQVLCERGVKGGGGPGRAMETKDAERGRQDRARAWGPPHFLGFCGSLSSAVSLESPSTASEVGLPCFRTALGCLSPLPCHFG